MSSLGRTFAQLKEFVRDNLWDAIKEKDDRRIVRAVYNGLEKAGLERDWSWMTVTHYRQLTVAPYGDAAGTTMSVAATAGSTTVTGTSTVFTAAMEGRYIKFEGLPELYQIKTRNSGTEIILQDAVSAAVASGSGFQVFAIRYDLPDNFREMRALADLSRRTDDCQIGPVDEVGFEMMLAASHEAGGLPESYAVLTKRNSVVKQLGFFPPPHDARYYQLKYVKNPGWFNASTGAFETEPTATTSLVDWPREYRAVLEKAILFEAAAEWKVPQWQQQASIAWIMARDAAAKRDQVMLEPQIYGQGARGGTYQPPRFFGTDGAEIR